MLEFTYNYGRGRVQLNLDEIIPCSAADLKRIMSFFNLSDDPEEHAKAVHNYIAAQVAELKEKRRQEDGNSAVGKERISKINANIKKYLTNAATLSKCYGLPEISDKAAQVVLHAATVYGVIYNRPENKWTVEPFNGWTFEKDVFSFDVRPEKHERKTTYIIMLHNTGAECARAEKKGAIVSEITPRLLDILKGKSAEIGKAKEKYNNLMIAAGYMEPERAETISNKEQEEENMSNFTFTTKNVTCKGKTFPCEYTVTEDGTVLVFVILREKESGRKEKQKIHFSPEHPEHAAALAAALAAAKAGEQHTNIAAGYKAETPAGNAEKSFYEYGMKNRGFAPLCQPKNGFIERKDDTTGRFYDIIVYNRELSPAEISEFELVPLTTAAETIQAEPESEQAAETIQAEPESEQAAETIQAEPEPERAAETIQAEPEPERAAETIQAEPERAARDSKQARGPVPEKTFIGETIQGNGWRIFFDGETGRTRVIFEGVPTEAAKAATQNAGFYYSPNMKSWNKKLTFKAYRAAKALSEQLSTLYAA